MSIYERIGSVSIRMFKKFIYYLITFIILILKKSRGISLYRFFEKKVDFVDYLILKYQLTIIFMISIVFLYIANILHSKKAVVLLELVASVYGMLTINSIRRFTDYKPYRDIYIIYIGIIAFLISAKGINIILYTVIAILLTVLAFLYFTRYYRDYTLGEVLEVNNSVKVKVHYDICAGVKPGIYYIKRPNIGIKVGDKVILRVKRRFLRKSEIVEIVDVEGE